MACRLAPLDMVDGIGGEKIGSQSGLITDVVSVVMNIDWTAGSELVRRKANLCGISLARVQREEGSTHTVYRH